MTISTTPYIANLLGKVRPPAFVLGYLRSDFASRLHHGLLSIFLDMEKREEISKAELARRINKGPEQITRWLSGPGNLTLDTVSDLAAGMGCRPVIVFEKIHQPVQQVHGIADTRETPTPLAALGPISSGSGENILGTQLADSKSSVPIGGQEMTQALGFRRAA